MYNLVVASRREEYVMQDISNTYQLNKYNKSGLPYIPTDIYLGAQIPGHREPDYDAEYFFYAIYGDKYVKNMVSNVQKKLIYHGI